MNINTVLLSWVSAHGHLQFMAKNRCGIYRTIHEEACVKDQSECYNTAHRQHNECLLNRSQISYSKVRNVWKLLWLYCKRLVKWRWPHMRAKIQTQVHNMILLWWAVHFALAMHHNIICTVPSQIKSKSMYLITMIYIVNTLYLPYSLAMTSKAKAYEETEIKLISSTNKTYNVVQWAICINRS